MLLSGRQLRPALTLLFVIMGGGLGYLTASKYPTLMQKIDPSFAKLPVEQLVPIYVVFIIVGSLFGFIAERTFFFHAKRAKEKLETMNIQDKIVFGLGVVLGMILTAVLNTSFKGLPFWGSVLAFIFFGIICVSALNSVKEQWIFYSPGSASGGSRSLKNRIGSMPKLLDTNVIIDGRIADICRAGFIEGPIYVPKFVLEELQQIADSGDSLKRARGRRGLEILNQMQKEMELDVPTFESDDMRAEVDARLVLAAKDIDAAIITNDYNLNKVAGLQGVKVLNINELANALKPVVLPGEEMTVTVIKEGKEKEQGIGYLDDGTMIVVENARRMIGETQDVSVTSVLQTVQGKMIFAKIKGSCDEGNSDFDNDFRAYNGSRPKPKIR